MEGEVRYCTSADGTRIAYGVTGGEGPGLLNCPGSWESFADTPPELKIFDLIWPGRVVVSYDFRGVGLSQRDAPSYTLERMVEDIEAVVDAAHLDRFSLVGSILSTPAAIRYSLKHPDRVTRMVLLTVVTESTDTMTPQVLQGLVALIRSNWEMGSQMLADMSNRASNPEVAMRLAESYRRSASGESVASMLTDLYETVHVREELKNLAIPTMIQHRKDNTPFGFSAAAHAAGVIPNARLVPLPGNGPTTLGQDAEANVRLVEAFLNEDPETRALTARPAAEPVDSAFRTILFTDLVSHTEMMSRLGDEAGRDVLREHERITREVLKANGGTEVKTMGDGFMASFGSVTRAVECAVALQRAFAEWNTSTAHPEALEGRAERPHLSVRVGLNAGEPIEEDGDLFGATVILASRIAAKAEGGEILVADTVRGLCSGKGFLFADRGDFVAKGFEEPVRISEVSWRG